VPSSSDEQMNVEKAVNEQPARTIGAVGARGMASGGANKAPRTGVTEEDEELGERGTFSSGRARARLWLVKVRRSMRGRRTKHLPARMQTVNLL
jgi:hypothetical protein